MNLKSAGKGRRVVYPVLLSLTIVLGLPLILGGISTTPLDFRAYAQDQGEVKVVEMALCLGIFNLEPVGKATEVSLEQGRIYTWTRISAQNPPTSIKHVYYHLGKKFVEVDLDVKSSSYRTWSYKSLPSTWALGQWRVEVLSATGNLLASEDFTVVK